MTTHGKIDTFPGAINIVLDMEAMVVAMVEFLDSVEEDMEITTMEIKSYHIAPINPIHNMDILSQWERTITSIILIS